MATNSKPFLYIAYGWLEPDKDWVGGHPKKTEKAALESLADACGLCAGLLFVVRVPRPEPIDRNIQRLYAGETANNDRNVRTVNGGK